MYLLMDWLTNTLCLVYSFYGVCIYAAHSLGRRNCKKKLSNIDLLTLAKIVLALVARFHFLSVLQSYY